MLQPRFPPPPLDPPMMGIASLKLKQEEAILSFLDGKDIFVSLPIGYGISLKLYVLLPLIINKIRGKLNRSSCAVKHTLYSFSYSKRARI